MNNSGKRTNLLFAVFIYGGLWGLVEATLGYLLHLLPELLPMPPMSGILLFPAGLFFMVRAARHSGEVVAIPGVALVAAIIKLTSMMLPFVSFRFVRNPALAILSEGAVAWIVLGIGGWQIDRLLPLKALVLSFGWRSLFLAVNLIFGLSGIAGKPLELQYRFIFLDGFFDAIIICVLALAVWLRAGRSAPDRKDLRLRPLSAVGALIAGIGGQLIFAGL